MREIKKYTRQLDVQKKLNTYGAALQALEEAPVNLRRARYFLLDLRPSEGKLTIWGFDGRELDRAMSEYLNVERSLEGPGSEAVLVSVESLDLLKRAYPNYFLDTRVFLDAMKATISD